MFLKSIKLTNLLSFGPNAQELELRPLNVLIGPNGCGKSNLIEAVSLLQAAPRDLPAPVREGGGVSDWIWRGEPKASDARLEVVVEKPRYATAAGNFFEDMARLLENPDGNLRYALAFKESGRRFELIEERIENEEPDEGYDKPYIYYELQGGRAVLNYKDILNYKDDKDPPQRKLRPDEIDPEQSILSQRKDPHHYPELTGLGKTFGRIRFYREGFFGRQTPPRLSQPADLANDFLAEDGANLALMLNRWRGEPEVKKRFLEALRQLYEGITDFDVRIYGNAIQTIIQEGGITVPANRLSDGTLRYLCLLAVLCHPNPPPLICIEEPELGLHPDILPGLADLLREASESCQLIVTTHSDTLVDALTDTPESVVVCEKHDGQTQLNRLKKDELSHWLEKYRLGELWSSGELGGNRW